MGRLRKMLKGIFNSIIIAGLLKSAAVAGAVGGFLRLAFTMISGKTDKAASFQKTSANTQAEAFAAPQTLRRRFNGFINDNLGFIGVPNDKKAARVYFLIAALKQVMALIARGAAGLSEALAIVEELARLGVKVSGLQLDAPQSDYTGATKIQSLAA